MKKKIPIKIFVQVAVGFFFSLLIILYFSFRLLFPLLLQIFNVEVAAYTIFILSFGICSLMVKPTFEKEMKKIDVPFSIVARNPEIEVQKEKISLKMLFQKSVISVIVAFILSLPLSIITFFRLMAAPIKDIDMILSLVHRYSWLYLIILGFSVFAIFIIVPSLRRWHWTKHQFLKIIKIITNYCTGYDPVIQKGFKAMIRHLASIALLSVLTGCAAFDSPTRWVDNNTFYSTKMPSIEVKVNQSLHYKQSVSKEIIAESERGNVHTGLAQEWFHFIDREKRLAINIETLANQERIYLSQIDWSNCPETLIASTQIIGGIEFATGIGCYQAPDNLPYMIKFYSTNIDDTTRYKIMYRERVHLSWLFKKESPLTSEDKVFLDSFNRRADESFSIAPYSSKQPPAPAS